jgi:biopolymer transport protein ExbD
MAMNVGRRGSCVAEINVTPMADVMIVLLIIFMVTTPVIVSETLPLPPAAHAQENDPDKALVLRLDGRGTLTIGEQEVGAYEPALRQVAEVTHADPQRAVWIKADRSVPYTWVAALADTCRRAGVESVTLATDRPEVP